MAEQKLPKLTTRVRFPSPAPVFLRIGLLHPRAFREAWFIEESLGRNCPACRAEIRLIARRILGSRPAANGFAKVSAMRPAPNHPALSSLAALALVAGLAACVADDGPSAPYAFVGTWDCGVETFTFTNTSYNDGTSTYPIRSVRRENSNYTLRFDNGFLLALGAVTETGLTWVSGTSGNMLNCRRLG